MVIGRNGSGIKAINAASGAWVKIAHIEEAMPCDGQRLVSHQSNLSICNILILINRCIYEVQKNKMTSHWQW
jgi:hypothetical protein